MLKYPNRLILNLMIEVLYISKNIIELSSLTSLILAINTTTYAKFLCHGYLCNNFLYFTVTEQINYGKHYLPTVHNCNFQGNINIWRCNRCQCHICSRISRMCRLFLAFFWFMICTCQNCTVGKRKPSNFHFVVKTS